MPFQTLVNRDMAPGIEGALASNNPISTVLGAFLAAASGAVIGRFGWAVNGAVSNAAGAARVPDGFIHNQQGALITEWRGRNTMAIPKGLPVELLDRGDVWVRATYNDAALNEKVFANLFNGSITTGPAGSFQTDPIGTSGTFTASVATNVLTVTAGSIYLAPGMKISGTGIPANTYIELQLSGTPGACTSATYQLTTYPGTVASGTLTAASNDGVGGAVGTASFATNVMTVTAVTSGQFAVGQLVKSAGVADGTYITALGTGTGGTGTYTLSTTPGTISAQAASASAWIETPFSVKQPGNVGDLIKIGVRF